MDTGEREWRTHVDTAREIARQAHAGQVDRAGKPYLQHCGRVAARVEAHGGQNGAIATAWLHDVLEDTATTEATLRTRGIPGDVVKAVKVLTRRRAETYREYIARIANSDARWARQVKLADLADHLERADQIPESLVGRYMRAREVLEHAPVEKDR